jgi:transposase, IS5 family
MLIDSYTPEDVFARVPELAVQTDPVLKQIDALLDDDQLFQQVRADLGKRYRQTLWHGRHSTPVEVILRLLLVKHLYTWSYEETIKRVADSLVLRWFCRVYFQRLPDESTLNRWVQTIRPETVHALNDRVVVLAAQAKVTKGRKLRVDATCVQTNIHHPTDSGLLVDSVRALSRLVRRAKPLVEGMSGQVKQVCRSRLLCARRVAQTLHRQLRHKGAQKEEEQRILYQQLITITQKMLQQAKQVVPALTQQSEQAAQRLLTSVQEVLPLIERVIHQARTRVLEKKKVASGEKVLSLHEPHTRAIPRHKGGALVEFGRHIIFDEVVGGIVTRFEILAHPNEHGQAVEAVTHHRHLFGHPPHLMVGDRGLHSSTTGEVLASAGVQMVAIPAVGPISQDRRRVEHSRAFKRAYRWRAGIEGRLQSLRRDYGIRRCAYHGGRGMERWIGLGVIASNLCHIAGARMVSNSSEKGKVQQ